jgi:GAF domain-containing protein
VGSTLGRLCHKTDRRSSGVDLVANAARENLENELQAATPDAERRLAETESDLVKTAALPLSGGGRTGRLVVGLNPRRPFDEGYQSFLGLVADQVGIAITTPARTKRNGSGRRRSPTSTARRPPSSATSATNFGRR